MTEAVWRPVRGFDNYEVSDLGEVRRRGSERPVAISENQYGVVAVKMMKRGVQFHRSLPKIVATAFVKQESVHFDTPINLDGNRHNNAASNLMWRPRWFARKYNEQFSDPYPNPITVPIKEVGKRKQYRDSYEVAVTFGLLEGDVVLSIMNRTYCWPTYQQFDTV